MKGSQGDTTKLSDKYKNAADELVEVARTKGYAQAIAMLTGDGAQQAQHADPAESLAKMANVAQTMFGIEDAKSRSIREDAQTTAQLMMGLMEKIMDNQKQGSSSDGAMSTILFQMMKDAQDRAERIAERAEERMREQAREHKEELDKAKSGSGKKDDDPVENFKNQLLINRLNYQPPSVKDQLEEAKETLAHLGISIGQTPGINEHELAIKKEEIQLKRDLAELEWKNKSEMETNKVDRIGTYIDKGTSAILGVLALVNPEVAKALGGAATQPGNTGANAQQIQLARLVCENQGCDYEIAMPVGQIIPACPNCGNRLREVR